MTSNAVFLSGSYTSLRVIDENVMTKPPYLLYTRPSIFLLFDQILIDKNTIKLFEYFQEIKEFANMASFFLELHDAKIIKDIDIQQPLFNSNFYDDDNLNFIKNHHKILRESPRTLLKKIIVGGLEILQDMKNLGLLEGMDDYDEFYQEVQAHVENEFKWWPRFSIYQMITILYLDIEMTKLISQRLDVPFYDWNHLKSAYEDIFLARANQGKEDIENRGTQISNLILKLCLPNKEFYSANDVLELRNSKYIEDYRTFVNDFTNECKSKSIYEQKDLATEFYKQLAEISMNCLKKYKSVNKWFLVESYITLPLDIMLGPFSILKQMGTDVAQEIITDKKMEPYSWTFFIENLKQLSHSDVKKII